MRVTITTLALATILFACKKENLTTQSVDALSATNAVSSFQPTVAVLNNQLNYPWEILWGPDNYIWFTEREGHVNRMNPATGEVTPVATIADVATTTNYNGLMGMVLHPQFETNPYVYVVYNYLAPSDTMFEKVVRFMYDGKTLVSPTILVDSIIGKKNGNYIHNGARLVISPDMKLFISTADANHRYLLPQNRNSLNGKILRVNLDGSIPADNPFGNAVWATGMRNPQGLVYASNGKMYSSMHGQTTDDEIDIIERKGNYGWPYIEGYINQDSIREVRFANNYKTIEPIYAWTPTIAPSGMDYYDKDSIAEWKNSLLVAVLKDEKLLQLKLNASGTAVESETAFLQHQYGRLRDVAIAPNGDVYVCTDNGNNADMIIRISK
ncbi:PQQ-dependent sugar dehydrogenase [Panacibacter sp. DH6]|uniref:PQQ-dependent sugar dehydrogenase n=1 Tax=Panacibacter microcysteis TaxID=2793269 RepID=A0A931E4E5_9BACT|nr:PQQ-dependent sugar dehydrogenase [Panacibacter microcysteis]MBG9374783.1 PQQ-dependent sugar dehydrogenase [Panacibacter microcysteis]